MLVWSMSVVTTQRAMCTNFNADFLKIKGTA